jgi:sigma-B regulation protein RsbU (phosphoserine phosphatase)
MSLRVRLALWVGGVSLAIQVLVLLVSLHAVRAVAIESAQAEMQRLVQLGPQAFSREGPGMHGAEAFVLSGSGEILDSPGPQHLPTLRAALAMGLVTPGMEGVAVLPGDEPVWFALHPIGPEGQTVGLMEREAHIMQRLDVVREEILVAGLVGSLGLLALVWVIAGGVTRPLLELAEAARHVARGRLDAPVPEVPQRDEVHTLAAAFTRMQQDLKDYLRELQSTVASKERMEGEFAIGSEIQRTFLPAIPVEKELSLLGGRVVLAARFRPARQMSGDLYDIFPLSQDRLALVIGDVAGKGLPAALLMVVTRTLVRAAARDNTSPAASLSRVNRLLCDENRSELFVTLQLLYLDLEHGRLVWANAGHPPPVLVSTEGLRPALKLPTGIVLGVDPDGAYTDEEVPLAAGETLILFSDGLSEARNPKNELFGEERLAQAGHRLAGGRVDAIVTGILGDLKAFAEGRPLEDDLTLVALRRVR